MKGRPDLHGRFRELIAARLDRPLTRAEQRTLTTHIKACAACQQVDREYREQRQMLRALPHRDPPRDMWARTSAALDREMARGSYRDGRGSRNRGFGDGRSTAPAAALMTTIAAMGLIAAVAVMQLAPAVVPPPPSAARAPTPFAVAPQRLAFVGTGAEDSAVYSTHVSQVCPSTAPDCHIGEQIVRTPITLPASMRARNIALSPSGYQLALVGRSSDQDVIAVVMLPSHDPGRPSGEPVAHPTSAAPEETPSPAVSATQPGGAPEASTTVTAPPASAVPGLTVLAILEDVDSAGAPPAWSPSGDMLAFSAMPADGAHGPDVYVWRPGDERAQPLTTDHGSFFASWAGERVVASRIVAAAENAEIDVITVAIDPETRDERTVDGPRMWLPTVNAQGTRAVVWAGELSWTDGLPSAGLGGLYLLDWTSLDPFAAPSPTESPTPPTEPPATAEPTPTRAPSPTAWPAESAPPSPSDEVSESGDPPITPELPQSPGASPYIPEPMPTSSPAEPEPDDAPTATPIVEPTAAGGASAERALSSTPLPGETASPEPSEQLSPEPTDAATAEPTDTLTPEPTDDATPEPTNTLTPAPTVAPTEHPLIALEPARDTRSAPVIDWQVSWSTDGKVLGVWIADVPGSSWGRLVVLAIDPQTQLVSAGDPLIAPTLARRGFTLGLSRVAWVGPSEGNPDGELRIRTWGVDGVGGLRLQPLEFEEVVPAF